MAMWVCVEYRQVIHSPIFLRLVEEFALKKKIFVVQ